MVLLDSNCQSPAPQEFLLRPLTYGNGVTRRESSETGSAGVPVRRHVYLYLTANFARAADEVFPA